MAQLALVTPAQTSRGRDALDLMLKARAAGQQHVADLLNTLEFAASQAQEIVDGGEVYPAGVRDAASKLIEQSYYTAQAVRSIMQYASPATA